MRIHILLLIVFSFPVLLLGQSEVDSILLELEKSSTDSQKVEIYLELSDPLVSPELSLALNWVQRAEVLSRKIGYKRGEYKALRTKGYLFQFYGETDSSIVYFRKLLYGNLLESTSDSSELFDKMGVYFISVENPDSALYYLNLAYKHYVETAPKFRLVGILVNMGNAFYAKGDLKQTFEYIEEAYFKALEIENYSQMPLVASNYIGVKIMLNNDTTNFMEMFEEVMNHPYVKGNQDMLANVHLNLAMFYLNNLNDNEKAESLFKEALRIYDNSDFKKDPVIFTGLGTVYLQRKEYEKAIVYFKKSLEHTGDLNNRNSAYRNLAKIYTLLNNADSASLYYNKVIEWMKENQKIDSDKLALKAKLNLEVVKREGEIAKLEDQHEIDVLKHNRSKIVQVSFVVLVLLLTTILILLNNQRKRHAALQKAELKLKTQNLVNLSLLINEKNQVLKLFEDKLKKNNSKELTEVLYSELKSTLKKSLKVEDDWKCFELYLNDLHKGFYDKLKSKYPDLSNTELRVCSLTKLRYSLKETAHTLSISPDSVKSSRYRIKKKIGLKGDQDLADFLNKV